MRCPACGFISEVIDERRTNDAVLRRYRCESCRGSWDTREVAMGCVSNSRPPVEAWNRRKALA